MINEILLRRKNKITVQKCNDVTDDKMRYVATIEKNIENLGYIFSCELFDTLRTFSKEELGDFYSELVPMLRNMRGANVIYRPMYPNFPRQVMGMDSAELYVNAVIHYLTYGKLKPVYEKDERLPLFDKGNLVVLELGNSDDLDSIFKDLVGAKSSLSAGDKEDIKWFFSHWDNCRLASMLPEIIPHKENMAYICKLWTEYVKTNTVQYRYLKTATDVLRFVVALSNGDVSLASPTRFRSYRRSERRMIMQLLENCVGPIEKEMQIRNTYWKRIAERIHPMEMKDKYPNAAKAFLSLDKPFTSYHGYVEAAISKKDETEAIKLLSSRPGEFARALDRMLRTFNTEIVLQSFERIADQVSTPVLIQLREHFIKRDELSYRIFFPKGNLARSYNIPNKLEPLDVRVKAAVVNVCEAALKEQYKERGDLGKVYLSKKLKNYIVPMQQRSASKAMKTMVRGSRVKIGDDCKAIRGFIWWTNTVEGDRVDIDLSAAIFDEQLNYLQHVSYTYLRSDDFRTYHSGDIINGGPIDGKGASEFLDSDINSIVERGGRYIVYQVYDYSGYGFHNLEHVMFGWMEREDVDSGEIFEPKTVVQKMDLSSKTTVCIPVIFDCVTREIIWCDMGVDIGSCSSWRGGCNLESNLGTVQAACYSVLNITQPNLYDLIYLHVCARGDLVDNKEDADVVFDISDGITPFDTEVIMNEYL